MLEGEPFVFSRGSLDKQLPSGNNTVAARGSLHGLMIAKSYGENLGGILGENR